MVVLGYNSKMLCSCERRWHTTDQEMHGVSRKWECYCSNGVIFHTDHQPLIMVKKSNSPRGKSARWLTELDNFDKPSDNKYEEKIYTIDQEEM